MDTLNITTSPAESIDTTVRSSIRLHSVSTNSQGTPNATAITVDCAVNLKPASIGSSAKHTLEITIPARCSEIAKLTNCYLQALRHAKNQSLRSLALPLLGADTWSLEETLHSLKSALMIFWRSGALDGEILPDMDIYLVTEDSTCKKEIENLCQSAFSLFLCDLTSWNTKGDRRMWEHLMHIFAEKNAPSAETFIPAIISEYKMLTGSDPLVNVAHEPHYVKELDFGGEGGGLVSDAFWKIVCLPILRMRSELLN